MRRPGPLQELPLARFLPVNAHGVQSPHKSTAKRPHSPGPTLFSPAKRRILNEEGIFSEQDLRKSPVRGRTVTLDLSGPHSPARRLDFGTPKVSRRVALDLDVSKDGLATPPPRSTRSSSKRLAPSPEFVPPKSSSSIPLLNNDESISYASHRSIPSTSTPVMVPREMPPSPDRQCAHYPGFDIHRDTHYEVPSSASSTTDEVDLRTDNDSIKENLAPRRKPKKVMSSPEELLRLNKGTTLGPNFSSTKGVKISKSVPDTPIQGSIRAPRLSAARDNASPRQSPRLHPGFTPGRTPRASKDINLERKQTLEMEVNNPDGDDEEDPEVVFVSTRN